MKLDTDLLPVLLHHVMEEVPVAVDEVLPFDEVKQGRCLPSSRIGMETLTYFGVKVEPMPCRAIAVDENWLRWQHEGGEPPMPEDSWSVAVGWESPGKGIDLHLVLVVEDELLLDLDAGQFDRPARGIHVPRTLLLPIAPVEVGGRTLRGAHTPLEGGGNVSYMEHPEPPRWKQGADWRLTGKYAGPVIRRVREAVKST